MAKKAQAKKKSPAKKKAPAKKTAAAKKTAPAKKKAPAPEEAPPGASGDVFGRLREVLAEHAAGYVVEHDAPGSFYVDTTHEYKGRPFFFGAVRQGKAYVSYHLFPVYVFPDLLDDASPALRRRMQGKACFNFRAVDEALFDELRALTRRGREAFQRRPLPAVVR